MKELFTKLGFSDAEVKAYLALAEIGKAPASVLAKRIEVPRSTAYTVLQSLIAKGVVLSEQEKDPIQYLPAPPHALRQLVHLEKERQQKELQAKESAAAELEELVKPFFQGKNFSVPKIQFFEGMKNVEGMLYANCPAWQESISHYDSTWWGYQDTRFVELYRPWLEHYWSTMLPNERINLLSNRAEVEKKLKSKVSQRTIKPLPKGYEFSCTIWALGDYLVLIMNRQEPHYAFQMKDSVFAANQRMLFQMLWSVLG